MMLPCASLVQIQDVVKLSLRCVRIAARGFSRRGQTSDDRIRLWDAATSSHLQTLKGHSYITTLSFSADGQYLKTSHGIVKINPDVDISDASTASGASASSGISDSTTKPSGNILFVDGDWITRDGKSFSGFLLITAHDAYRYTTNR